MIMVMLCSLSTPLYAMNNNESTTSSDIVTRAPAGYSFNKTYTYRGVTVTITTNLVWSSLYNNYVYGGFSYTTRNGNATVKKVSDDKRNCSVTYAVTVGPGTQNYKVTW